ncbi:hypothetical protein Tco_0507939 [Tanacetum coccineum]
MPTRTTSKWFLISFQSVALGRHSPGHPPNTRNTLLNFDTLPRNVIRANYQAYLMDYDEPPTKELVKQWFPTIGYGGPIEAIDTVKKSDGLNYSVLRGQNCIEMEGYRTMKSIYPLKSLVSQLDTEEEPTLRTSSLLPTCGYLQCKKAMAFKAPQTSSYTKKNEPKGKKSRAKYGHRKQLLVSKNHPQSKIEQPKVCLSQKRPLNPKLAILRKERSLVQQATNGQAFLRVTGEGGANPQLSSVKSSSHSKHAFQLLQLFTLSLHQDMMLRQIPQLKLILENLLLRILNLNNMVMMKEPKTIYLIIFLQEAIYDQEFNTSLELTNSDYVTKEIKLEDMSKLEEEVHVEPHTKTEDTLVLPPRPSSKTIKIQEFFNHPFPMWNSSLSYWFDEISRAVIDLKKYVEGLEIEIPRDLKETPEKLDEFWSTVLGLTKQLSKLKVLDALQSHLNKVTEALNKFATAIRLASNITSDQSVPLAGQADTHPTEGKKNTQQATITQLFQRRIEKVAARANLNKQTIIATTTPETTIVPPTTTITTLVIFTILPFKSPFLSSPPKTTPT